MLKRMALFQRPRSWRRGINLPFWRNLALSGLSILATVSSAQAQPGSATFDPSVTLAKHVNLAATYWEQHNFVKAKDEYRKALYYSPTFVGFLEGVINCSQETKDWADVADAIEKISVLAPDKKTIYEYDYGIALYNLNKYDEAVPHLRKALASVDLPLPVFKPLKINSETTPLAGPDLLPVDQSNATTPGAQKVLLPGDGIDVTSSSPVDQMGHELLTFNNAIAAESIVIAEYLGCDKSEDIRYNSPPTVHYHIVQYLKGPPLNRALPVRYQFHTQYDVTVPANWKFDLGMLPSRGSKWIMFIEPAVPERGAFNTWGGSFGRQPATQANLDRIDQLLDSHNMKLLQ